MARIFSRIGLGSCVVLCALLLGGCAIAPVSTRNEAPPTRDTLAAFSLEGRFSLLSEGKSYSGRLSWRHAGASNENGARLTSGDGKVSTAADAETLTLKVLGYSLPLAQLTDWVRGRNSGIGQVEPDAFGRPLRVRHEDWRIEYGYGDDDPQAAPNRVFAQRIGGIDLRLSIDEWTSLPSESQAP